MFAARASKGSLTSSTSNPAQGHTLGTPTSAQQNGTTSRATSNTGIAHTTPSSLSSLSRSKLLAAYSAGPGSDSENSWAPIRADTFKSEDGATRQFPRFGGSGVDNSPIDEDFVYSKNDRTLVAYFGPLPREVDEVLSKTDFYTQPVEARMDFDAGFGMVVSQTKCYIWAVQKDVTYRSPPMCISLPMPPSSFTDTETLVLLPVVTITKSDDQHSGVLACSPDGTCWYWNNIDLSLSNVNQHVDAKIDVAPNDRVTHVECAGPMGYYFGTRYSNVYQVSIKKQFGSAVLSTNQLQGKSGGALASFYNILGKGQGLDTTQRVKSMTSGPKIQDPHGRWDLFAMAHRSLFKWNLNRSGDCTLEAEIPLKEKITERILRDYSGTLPLGSDPEVKMLDIEYIKNGKLLVLVTFFDTTDKHHHTPLSCALFTLTPQFGAEIDIESVKYIQRKIEEDLRPRSSPKLVVPKGGPGVFIVMPKAVIISSTLPKLDFFEDLVPLKTDKIIGFGTEDWKQRGLEMEDSSELPIVCRASGRLGINIQLDDIRSPSLSLSSSSTLGIAGTMGDIRTSQEQLTAQLQAKLEQAVFFGGKKNNPISFDLGHYDGGDLNQASLKVSKEILNSYAALLSSGKDLTGTLAERYQRIKSIIESIQAADMSSRLSIDTRFQLCWSAEKLAAAYALWHQYQLKLRSASINRRPKDQSVTSRTNLKQAMDDAAAQSLRKLGAHTTEDPVSFFLKYHVDDLAELLSNLQKATRKLSSVSDGEQAELTRNINKLTVLSLRSAWNYRKQHVANYALQSTSSVEPWTGTENGIKSLMAQYMETLSICKKNQTVGPGAMDVEGPSYLNNELEDQLCDLADITLQAHSERLQYLEGLPLSSEHNFAIAAAVDAYDKAKSDLLTPLVELKKIHPAVQLAQRYKDFKTLVDLSIGQEKQIEHYISKYQQEFADALFQWYYDNDELSVMLEVGEKYGDMFTVYLDNRDYAELAWMHDIKIRRFVEASQRVQERAVVETDLNCRRTMFSLSKLLFLAGVSQQQPQLEGGNATVDSMMKYASRTDEELEMATAQALIANAWDQKVGALVSVEEKARAVVKAFGSALLPEQPVLSKAICKAIETLLSRQAISSEDFLDILLLQQSFEISNLNVLDAAFKICLHSADIPQSRRPYVLQDIWRRIFIAGSVQDAYWRLEDVSEAEAIERLRGLWIYGAFVHVYREEGEGGAKEDLLLRPQDARSTMPSELFKERFEGRGHRGDKQMGEDAYAERNYKGMIQDYELENEELERRIRDGQLLEKWERIKKIVKQEASGASGALPATSQDVEMENVEM